MSIAEPQPRWSDEARAASSPARRGRHPVVGGTGLYFDPAVRHRSHPDIVLMFAPRCARRRRCPHRAHPRRPKRRAPQPRRLIHHRLRARSRPLTGQPPPWHAAHRGGIIDTITSPRWSCSHAEWLRARRQRPSRCSITARSLRSKRARRNLDPDLPAMRAIGVADRAILASDRPRRRSPPRRDAQYAKRQYTWFATSRRRLAAPTGH